MKRSDRAVLRPPSWAAVALAHVAVLAVLLASAPTQAAGGVGVFAEVAKVAASDDTREAYFGVSLALDGERLVVGAPEDGDAEREAGAVYVFERDGAGTWQEVAKLTVDSPRVFEQFGWSVSLDGDRTAVGANYRVINPGTTSSAYIFERDVNGSWSQMAEMISSDAAPLDLFGSSIALDGDRVVIGAERNSELGPRAGAAYVFEQQANGSWLEVVKLTASDGASYERFGGAAALEGDRIVIGAKAGGLLTSSPGAVYVFESDGFGAWVEVAKVTAPDGEADDLFGTALSLAGDRLIVGAQRDDEGAENAGSAYIFERQPDGHWQVVAKLVAPDGDAFDAFGSSVAQAGPRVAVSVASDDDHGLNSGAVHLFEIDSGGWVHRAKLTPLDGRGAANFGWALAGDRDRLAIGTEIDGPDGFIYVFDRVLVSPEIEIAGACPGEIELSIDQVTPRDGLELIGGVALGSSTLESGPCAGTEVDLEAPVSLRTANSGFDPAASVVRMVPASRCGSFVQLIDERTCLISNVAQIPAAE